MLEQLTKIADQLGVHDLTTAGVWLGAGFVLGLIMVGRRPIGLLGDLIVGLIGGAAGGYAFERFGGSLHLEDYVTKIAPSLAKPEHTNNPHYIVAFVAAFLGALVLLFLLRLLIRR